MTIIIGIDPGSLLTGYGVIQVDKSEYHHLSSGCVKTQGDSSTEKLYTIFTALQSVVHHYSPLEAAIEQVFFHRNPSSALKLGQARGVAILVAALATIPIAEYSARQIKQSVVGYGAAQKAQIQYMVRILLKLKEVPTPDAADALAVALCHAHARRNIQLIDQHPALSSARSGLQRRFRQGRLR